MPASGVTADLEEDLIGVKLGVHCGSLCHLVLEMHLGGDWRSRKFNRYITRQALCTADASLILEAGKGDVQKCKLSFTDSVLQGAWPGCFA
jgi:hypothetical protein